MAKSFICPKCQHIGKPGKKKRGSAGVELFGWAVFPLGVPYTIWRMFSKIPVCKMCGHEPLIDEQSVVGQKLMEKIYGLDKEIKNAKPLESPIKKIAEAPLPPPPAEPRARMDLSRPEKDPEQF